jgi:hypothetical protein
MYLGVAAQSYMEVGSPITPDALLFMAKMKPSSVLVPFVASYLAVQLAPGFSPMFASTIAQIGAGAAASYVGTRLAGQGL